MLEYVVVFSAFTYALTQASSEALVVTFVVCAALQAAQAWPSKKKP